MNHEPLFELELDGVRVGDDAIIGSLEQGAEILAWTINRTTVAPVRGGLGRRRAGGAHDRAVHV